MFKNFSNSRRNNAFNGFPNLNFQMNNEAYGFSGCTFWLDAAYGLNTQTNGAAISQWIEKIRNYRYTQSTVANQFSLISSDPSFGNYPVIQSSPSISTSKSLSLTGGPVISFSGNTLAVVYQKTGDNPGSGSSRRNGFFGDGATGSTGQHFILGVFAASVWNYQVGFTRLGTTFDLSDASIADNNVRILVVSGLNWISNGSIITPTGSSHGGVQINTIGSSSVNEGAAFKLAEIISFGVSFSQADCIRLCDNINSKYALY